MYYLRMPRSAVIALALAVLLPWVLVAALSWRSRPSTVQAATAPVVARPVRSDKLHCRLGPWGAIEYFEIVTQPPDEYISPNFFSDVHTQWVFKGYSKAGLDELFVAAGLTPAQCSAMYNCAAFSAGQCVVKPSNAGVKALSPAARARTYAALAKFPENAAQRDPFIFKAAKIGEWLDKGGLAPSTVALVKGLLYPHGDSLLLADCNTIVNELPSAEERVRLLKILLRRTAVFPRLRVTADSSIKELIGYWGKGGRQTAVSPLLESIPPTSNGITVDVALLLPVFARERLYTYPVPSVSAQAMHDCHWSALNFFNAQPDERFSRPDAVRAALTNDYYPLPGSPSFGDLVLFSAPDHTVVHAAVYVADDILFTKNGPSFVSPWLLMTQAEVMASFPAYDKLEVTYQRLKKM